MQLLKLCLLFRIVGNSSAAMFSRIFLKLQNYLQGKIVEPTVAGGILASMCKGFLQYRLETSKSLNLVLTFLSDLISNQNPESTIHFNIEEKDLSN